MTARKLLPHAGAVTVDSVGGLLRELQPELARGIDTLDFSASRLPLGRLALIFSAMRHARQLDIP